MERLESDRPSEDDIAGSIKPWTVVKGKAEVIGISLVNVIYIPRLELSWEAHLNLIIFQSAPPPPDRTLSIITRMSRQFFVGGNFKMNPVSRGEKENIVKILNEADVDPNTGDCPINRLFGGTDTTFRGRHCPPGVVHSSSYRYLA